MQQPETKTKKIHDMPIGTCSNCGEETHKLATLKGKDLIITLCEECLINSDN